MNTSQPAEPGEAQPLARLARRQLSFGWYALLCFSTLGLLLEALHALKAGFYLNVDTEARRLLWRLTHAHGTLLSLVNLAFALTLPRVRAAYQGRMPLAATCLKSATVLLPAGFFLGGLFVRGADPGLAVLLVPPGALLLLIAIGLTARSLR